MGCGGAMPSVRLPSLTEGSNSPACTAALYSATVLEALGVDAQPVRELAQRARLDARGARRLAVDLAQQSDGPLVEHLRGDPLGLAQHLAP